MPGSDDQYDQVHTYSQDHAGKSKTTKPAVRELGRDGAPTRLVVFDERDTPRTPPTGTLYLFANNQDQFELVRPDGSTSIIPSSASTFSDTGNDNPDGGDIYQLPQVQDSIDGQGGMELTALERVETGDLTGTYPGEVRAIANGEVVSTIDPANTTTPVQDAHDAITGTTAASGTVFLPPATVDEASQVDWRSTYDVNLVGYGRRASAINFTSGTDKGFLWSKTQACTFRDFRVTGPQSGNSSAVIRIDDTGTGNLKVNMNVWDRFEVRGWNGNFLEVVGGAAPFENTFAPSYGLLSTIDAGAETAMINWAVGGRANFFGSLAIYPDDSVSAADSAIYNDLTGGDNSAMFQWLNLGGTAGPIADVNGGFTMGAVNFEPATQNTTTHDLFTLRGSTSPQRVYHVETAGGPTVDSIYTIQSGGNAWLASPWTRGAATISTNIVDIQDSPAGGQGTVYYFGPAGNITNSTAETNNSVRSLATAGGANG